MTESDIAIVTAQAALLNAEVSGMQAFNAWRQGIGAQIEYSDDAFSAAMERYPALVALRSAKLSTDISAGK